MGFRNLLALDAMWKFVAVGTAVGLFLPAAGVALHGVLADAGATVPVAYWHFTVAPLLGAGAGYLVGRGSRDVRRAARAQRQRARTVTELFDGLGTAVYRTTLDGHVVYANQGMADMFGYASPDVLARISVETLYARGEDRVALLSQLRDEGSVYAKLVLLVRRDGERFEGHITAHLQGEHILGVIVREADVDRPILSVCSNCDRARTPDGRWEKLSVALTERRLNTGGGVGWVFSHGLCAQCGQELYGEVLGRLDQRD